MFSMFYIRTFCNLTLNITAARELLIPRLDVAILRSVESSASSYHDIMCHATCMHLLCWSPTIVRDITLGPKAMESYLWALLIAIILKENDNILSKPKDFTVFANQNIMLCLNIKDWLPRPGCNESVMNPTSRNSRESDL